VPGCVGQVFVGAVVLKREPKMPLPSGSRALVCSLLSTASSPLLLSVASLLVHCVLLLSQGHPNWLQLGPVVHGFDSTSTLTLTNHNPAPVNLLSVSIRCDVAEYLSVTLRADNTSGVISATYTVPGYRGASLPLCS
jgi:hypothetical protein